MFKMLIILSDSQDFLSGRTDLLKNASTKDQKSQLRDWLKNLSFFIRKISLGENYLDLAPFQENVLEALNTDVKYLDATGFRISKKAQWLHVISNSFATHYRAREKRGDLLEDLKEVLLHKHWKPYVQLKDVSHALCNTHHLRELKAWKSLRKKSGLSK